MQSQKKKKKRQQTNKNSRHNPDQELPEIPFAFVERWQYQKKNGIYKGNVVPHAILAILSRLSIIPQSVSNHS